MVTCSGCKKKLEMNFLNKPFGTVVKTDGKKRWLCRECQKKEFT